MADTKQNGTAIRVLREIRGLSRDDLAQRIGKEYPTLANIENEHKDATAVVMHRIAAELDVPVAAILRRPLYAEGQDVA